MHTRRYVLRDCVGEIDVDIYLKRDRPPPKAKHEPGWLTGDSGRKAEKPPEGGEKLPTGARVEIYGLTSEAGSALNGLHGHIGGWDGTKGRYDVQLEIEDKTVSCKPANVKRTSVTPSGRKVG